MADSAMNFFLSLIFRPSIEIEVDRVDSSIWYFALDFYENKVAPLFSSWLELIMNFGMDSLSLIFPLFQKESMELTTSEICIIKWCKLWSREYSKVELSFDLIKFQSNPSLVITLKSSLLYSDDQLKFYIFMLKFWIPFWFGFGLFRSRENGSTKISWFPLFVADR